MPTHTIKGFITHTTYPWTPDPAIGFQQSTDPTFTANEYTVAVAPHSFEVEVPHNFDPNPHKVAGMRAKIDKIKIAAFEEITNLQQEIEKLLCLSYEAPAPGTVFEDVPDEAIEYHTGASE